MAQQRHKGLDKDIYKFTDGLHQQDIFNVIQSFYNDAVCTDIELRSNDGYTEKCHKLILCASSPYFHAMFTSGLSECRSKSVLLKDMDGSTLKLLLQFMYTSKIEITTENVQNIVIASSLLQLHRLQKECEEFIIYHLDIDNCVSCYRLSDIHSFIRVKEKALLMMLQQFSELVDSHEFLNLSNQQLITYLQNEKLHSTNEVAVFNAVTNWVDHNKDEDVFKEDHMRSVMKCVRFHLCSKDFIIGIAMPHKYAQSRELQDTLRQVLSTENTNSIEDCSIERSGDKKQLIMYDDNDFVYYNPFKDMWDVFCSCPEEVVVTSAPVDTAVFGHQVCAAGKGLILTGGWDGEKAYKHCWQYDMSRRQWTEEAGMIKARCTHAMSVYKDSLYVIGGLYSDMATTNTIEHINVKSIAWSTVKEGIPPLCYVETASIGPVIYILGDGQDSLKLYEFHIETHQFVHGVCVPFSESRSMVAYKDSLYSFDCEIFYCYDIFTKNWTSINYSRIGDVLTCPVVCNGDIICMASTWDLRRPLETLGENEKPKVVKSGIQKFNVARNQWEQLYKVQEYQPSGHQGAALPMLAADITKWHMFNAER